MIKTATLVTVVVCLLAALMLAQETTGGIEGTVTDRTSGIIPAARVTAET